MACLCSQYRLFHDISQGSLSYWEYKEHGRMASSGMSLAKMEPVSSSRAKYSHSGVFAKTKQVELGLVNLVSRASEQRMAKRTSWSGSR